MSKNFRALTEFRHGPHLCQPGKVYRCVDEDDAAWCIRAGWAEAAAPDAQVDDTISAVLLANAREQHGRTDSPDVAFKPAE